MRKKEKQLRAAIPKKTEGMSGLCTTIPMWTKIQENPEGVCNERATKRRKERRGNRTDFTRLCMYDGAVAS
jgi:hypothetical protein